MIFIIIYLTLLDAIIHDRHNKVNKVYLQDFSGSGENYMTRQKS